MSSPNITSLPNDPDALRALALAMQERLSDQALVLAEQAKALSEKDALLATKEQLIRSHERELVLLRQQLAELKRQRYGRKSEKLDEQIQQLELIIEDLETNCTTLTSPELQAPVTENKTGPTSRRQPLPDHLPQETINHDAPSSCTCCGGELNYIGEDVSEQLEYIPAQFKRIRHVRAKYSCTHCKTIMQAEAPPRPIPRSYFGPGLLAHVAVSKYTDHLPLYRQSVIYARDGVHLERSTLADWMGQVCRLMSPLHDALHHYVMAASKIHGDDTPVPVLQPGRKTTKQGRLWAYLRDDRSAGIKEPPAVWLAYTPDRKGKWPVEHLKSFTGLLQADGFAGFNGLYQSGRVKEVACWAHTRRKFYEIAQTDPTSVAHDVLKQIAELYRVEQEIKGQPKEKRQRIRQARAGPVIAELKNQLTQTFTRVSRKSPLAKAIHYALVRWEALSRYVDDGRLEIDNNPVEREIRPVALGRKNYLFAGADSGGERAAMLYSLLNTAKLNGIEPEAYLRTVIERIAETPINRVDQLLPWNLAVSEPALVNT